MSGRDWVQLTISIRIVDKFNCVKHLGGGGCIKHDGNLFMIFSVGCSSSFHITKKLPISSGIIATLLSGLEGKNVAHGREGMDFVGMLLLHT